MNPSPITSPSTLLIYSESHLGIVENMNSLVVLFIISENGEVI